MAALLFFVALRIISGGENTWICVENEWVRHGNPSAPKPETGCGIYKGIADVGSLSGKVTAGPFCPVERVGVPCPVPPDAYSSRDVRIYKTDGTTLVTTKNLNADGTYKLELPAGEYIAEVVGFGMRGNERFRVKILTAQTTELNFNIDTGIR